MAVKGSTVSSLIPFRHIMNDLLADNIKLNLVPLCRAKIELGPRLSVSDGPWGNRSVVSISSINLEGPRITAAAAGQVNADWLTTSNDGTIVALNVRAVLSTHDGAIVIIRYRGRMKLVAKPPFVAYVAPLFETGDERYRWLNSLQAVGKGLFDPTERTVCHTLFELA